MEKSHAQSSLPPNHTPRLSDTKHGCIVLERIHNMVSHQGGRHARPGTLTLE